MKKKFQNPSSNHGIQIGGISKFGQWMSEMGLDDYELYIEFLRDLQSLRPLVIGHRKRQEYEKVVLKFNLRGENYTDDFINILERSIDFLSFIDEILIQ